MLHFFFLGKKGGGMEKRWEKKRLEKYVPVKQFGQALESLMRGASPRGAMGKKASERKMRRRGKDSQIGNRERERQIPISLFGYSLFLH